MMAWKWKRMMLITLVPEGRGATAIKATMEAMAIDMEAIKATVDMEAIKATVDMEAIKATVDMEAIKAMVDMVTNVEAMVANTEEHTGH